MRMVGDACGSVAVKCLVLMIGCQVSDDGRQVSAAGSTRAVVMDMLTIQVEEGQFRERPAVYRSVLGVAQWLVLLPAWASLGQVEVSPVALTVAFKLFTSLTWPPL